MRIEDYWDDIVLYSISFKSGCGRNISKLIVLPAKIDDEESVKEIIKKKFNNVSQVMRVEKLEEGLSIKIK